MRRRTYIPALLAVLLVHCKGEPDFVAMTTPPSCDLRSQLVRRGYPENLDQILVPGNCTATRTPGMRGPDFSFWLAGAQTPWADCNSTQPQFEPMFWTESGPDGKIIRVHFCPEFCEELRERLFQQLEKDVACARDAGLADEAGLPPAPAAGAGAGGAGGVGAAGTEAGAAGLAAGAGAAVGGAGAAGLAGSTAGVAGSAGTPVAGTAGGVAAGAGGAAAAAGAAAGGASGGAAAGASGGSGGAAGAGGSSAAAGRSSARGLPVAGAR